MEDDAWRVEVGRDEEQGDPLRAVDRRALAAVHGPKDGRWPRTDRRQARVSRVLSRRQPDLTVVLEDVHDPHNASAVLRACDAVGVATVHLVYDREEPPARAFARTTSASAAKWVETVTHPDIATCYGALRVAGFRIVATTLAPDSHDLYDLDLARPTALVLGNEHRGVSDAAAEAADDRAVIPMQGMVESLNISVAGAVALFEAMRQRRAAGAYDAPRYDPVTLAALTEDWLRR
ncbi:MAG: tRNA (guanosine(18)-2'-O)-methyltransferase [uncultured Thermomicrobiales bacterium]|uniref:tRNA (guanosine(18)-2'-O)-methyltransferase n=1 Tax=uncultured Thermomicrobiales bacterium TaxID=1645740 RepID=A0A6J4UAU4_9BACT|nr:MAG: tRNA (guanosine(18)-2'-O)-methyltransferase [uncultured Thermomicrobiales bacterium]